MNINYSYKNMLLPEKSFCENYFAQKLKKLDKIVNEVFSEATLEFRAERFVKKAAFNISLILAGNSKLFVSEDDHTLPEAIDLAVDKLVERLRKVEDKRKNKR